jgi:hypothetical protein
VLDAACSSSPSATRPVASLGSGTTRTTVALTEQKSEQDFIDYARCLRAHGVNEPDPTHRPGHNGLSVEVPPRTTGTANALDLCNHFIAAIVQEKAAAAPQLSAAAMRSLTAWASCMRSHDIDMLDPTPQGQLNLGHVPGITAGYGRYSPQFRSADRACRRLLPAGINDDGTGP